MSKYKRKTKTPVQQSDKNDTQKRSVGRPAQYMESYAEQAYLLCSKYGATIKDLAQFFKVDPSTIEVWRHKYAEFGTSVNQGRDYFDTNVVEKALLQRALGMEKTVQDKRRFTKTAVNEDGTVRKETTQQIVDRTIYVPPDTRAATFWLTNRNPDRWQNHQTVNKTVDHRHAHIHAVTLNPDPHAAAATLDVLIQAGLVLPNPDRTITQESLRLIGDTSPHAQPQTLIDAIKDKEKAESQ